jgi:hypothetical protein
MVEQHIVWLIDGDRVAARQHQLLLQHNNALTVQLVPIRARVEDYADLAAHPETGAVLISRLVELYSGGVYNSAMIADYLRALRPDLPLFLLVDDGSGDVGGPSVDGAFSVADLYQQPDVYRRRLLRAVGRYEQAMSTRQQRLQVLLDADLAGTLDATGAEELAALRADFERAAEVSQAKRVAQHEVDLAEKRQLVTQLEAIAQQLRAARRHE